MVVTQMVEAASNKREKRMRNFWIFLMAFVLLAGAPASFAQKKNKAVKVTLRKLIDNQETFSGKVSEISDTGFVLTDQKTQTTKTFAYKDVQQVKQKGMSKGTKILIFSLVVGFVIAMGFRACNVEGGPHC